jgi:hypothetical protein
MITERKMTTKATRSKLGKENGEDDEAEEFNI